MPAIYWPQLLGGLALCLFGWTLYWVGLHLAGGLAGAGVGALGAWAGAQMASLNPSQTLWIAPLGGLVGFVLGVFLVRGLHRFFFFLAGAAMGFALGYRAWEWALWRFDVVAANATLWQILVVIASAGLMGVAMVYGSRWLVALVTSITGAALAVFAVGDPLALYGFPPLALAAFALQIGLLRGMRPANRPSRQRLDDEDLAE